MKYYPHFPRFNPARVFNSSLIGLALYLVVSINMQLANQQKRTDILGASNESQKLTQLIREKQKLETNQNYWQQIIQDHPLYRDGYIQLAVINYQLGNTDATREFIVSAQKLDPNNTNVITLAKVFLLP